jgi:hypothetical protein
LRKLGQVDLARLLGCQPTFPTTSHTPLTDQDKVRRPLSLHWQVPLGSTNLDMSCAQKSESDLAEALLFD